MPVSKHRRHGKQRPRPPGAAPPSWLPPLTPEEQAERDAEVAIGERNTELVYARLETMFGGSAWSDEQYGLARDELEAEGALVAVPGRISPES